MSKAETIITAEQVDTNNKVLDLLIEKMQLKNDAALSRALEVAPAVISKIRHGKVGFGDSVLIRAHEATGLPIRELKQQLGRPSIEPRLAA